MAKDATSHAIDLEAAQVEYLKQVAGMHGLPDIGKAIRCLINYAREHPDKHADMFAEFRCLDC